MKKKVTKQKIGSNVIIKLIKYKNAIGLIIGELPTGFIVNILNSPNVEHINKIVLIKGGDIKW